MYDLNRSGTGYCVLDGRGPKPQILDTRPGLLGNILHRVGAATTATLRGLRPLATRWKVKQEEEAAGISGLLPFAASPRIARLNPQRRREEASWDARVTSQWAVHLQENDWRENERRTEVVPHVRRNGAAIPACAGSMT